VNGFQVLRATGSKLAMSMIDDCMPAAVILDIMMPDISGLEAGTSIYLTKPVNYIDLKRTVEKVLGA
jgi:DNA-binding response OmpR family regulator